VEFVVLLPLLLVILASIYFVFNRYDAKQTAMLRARSCGWRFAIDGCADGPPDGCSTGASGEDAGGLDGASAQLAPSEGSWLDAAARLPIIGPAFEELFGTGIVGSAEASAIRPQLLGGGEVTYQGSFYVLCNTRHRTLAEYATETFCSLIDRELAEKLNNCADYLDQSGQIDSLQDLPSDS